VARRGARLALEARDGFLLVRVVVELEDLDRDAAVHRDVPRGDDDAHPARADDGFDAVLLADDVADLDGRVGVGFGLGAAHGVRRFSETPGAPLPPSALAPADPGTITVPVC
jgi:hypothetical protein